MWQATYTRIYSACAMSVSKRKKQYISGSNINEIRVAVEWIGIWRIVYMFKYVYPIFGYSSVK